MGLWFEVLIAGTLVLFAVREVVVTRRSLRADRAAEARGDGAPSDVLTAADRADDGHADDADDLGS